MIVSLCSVVACATCLWKFRTVPPRAQWPRVRLFEILITRYKMILIGFDMWNRRKEEALRPLHNTPRSPSCLFARLFIRFIRNIALCVDFL